MSDTATIGKRGKGKSINTKRFLGKLKINASYMVAYDSHDNSIVSYMSKQR
tara:strand:- start:6318 stop:6470 length:153 start_codon:yes stop_codon:yes gene_type:complete